MNKSYEIQKDGEVIVKTDNKDRKLPNCTNLEERLMQENKIEEIVIEIMKTIQKISEGKKEQDQLVSLWNRLDSYVPSPITFSLVFMLLKEHHIAPAIITGIILTYASVASARKNENEKKDELNGLASELLYLQEVYTKAVEQLQEIIRNATPVVGESSKKIKLKEPSAEEKEAFEKARKEHFQEGYNRRENLKKQKRKLLKGKLQNQMRDLFSIEMQISIESEESPKEEFYLQENQDDKTL